MRILSIARAAFAATFVLASSLAYSAPIPLGAGVTFAGSGTPLGSPTWFNSTGVASFANDWVVTASSGAAYAGTVGTAVNMQTFTWTPFAANNPVWSFTANGFVYTLSVSTAAVASTTNAPLPQVVVTGTGVLSIAGSTFTPTAGTFTFTGTTGTTGLDLSFVSTATPAQVPEPHTLALIGIALAGLGFMRMRAKS